MFDFVLFCGRDVIGTPSFSQLPQQLLQEVLFAASRRGVNIGASVCVNVPGTGANGNSSVSSASTPPAPPAQ